MVAAKKARKKRTKRNCSTGPRCGVRRKSRKTKAWYATKASKCGNPSYLAKAHKICKYTRKRIRTQNAVNRAHKRGQARRSGRKGKTGLAALGF